ncbi:UNKNOWN [Stylonychia lemnae]|uniref:Uncharacterized protein n=1 Tax=Stylonychia lemnae TaxID=5949 RepID=A0A078B3G8_STYLE|nr:UNKNOWN [Stylonychia lemnae]|eukprot:CDW89075.1 UNKNOWN [Stylonychia lemnae]
MVLILIELQIETKCKSSRKQVKLQHKKNLQEEIFPESFNGNCFACVTNNYTFCSPSSVCQINSTCDVNTTEVFTSKSGCPVNNSCSDFGLNGVGYIGEPSLMGGFQVNDSMVIQAPPNYPCAIALFNSKKEDLDVTITGFGVKSYATKISLPFKKTSYGQFNDDFRILPSDDVVMFYVGSVTGQSSFGGIIWTKHFNENSGVDINPTVPNKPTGSRSIYLKFLTSFTLLITLFTALNL